MRKDLKEETPEDSFFTKERIKGEDNKSSKEEKGITDLTEEDLPTIVFEGEKIDIKYGGIRESFKLIK